MIFNFKRLTLAAFSAGLALSVSSCDEKISGGGNDKPIEVKNAILCGDELYQIRSVVYTKEETEGFTVFYFSPTRGISDVDGMNGAGDFLKVCVDDISGNAVDFQKEGNAVSFRELTVDKGNIASFKDVSFNIELMEHKYVSLSFSFMSEDKGLFAADYYGECRIYPSDPTLDWDYSATSSGIEVMYTGENKEYNTVNYTLAMATAPYVIDGVGNIYFESEGYLLIVELFAEPVQESSYVFPTGTFSASRFSEAGTYDSKKSGLLHYHKEGDTDPFVKLLENDLIVKSYEKDGMRMYTIETSFEDEDGIQRTIGYDGPVNVLYQSSQLPSLDAPKTDLVASRADGVYLGNLFGKKTGLVTINLYDEVYDNEDNGGGYSASLAVFAKMFNGEEAPRLVAGTYNVQESPVGEENTALVGMPVSMMGQIFPFGTYIHQDTGGMGKFGMAKSGKIVIEETVVDGEGKQNYKISFDLVSQEGLAMKGSYEGQVEVTDQSDDGIKDDGTSTLNGDYEMNLDLISKGRLYPLGEIEGPDGEKYSHQRLDIGSRSGLDAGEVIGVHPNDVYGMDPGDIDPDARVCEDAKGDIFSVGLITRHGEDGMLAPGKYPIVEENWPAYQLPGHALKGGWSNSPTPDMTYTSWMHFIVGNKSFIMDGHALIYAGEVTVERDDADEEGVFTISVDGYCVRQYNLTGSWKGKVTLGRNSDTPVKAAEPFVSSPDALSVMRSNARMMKEAAIHFRSGATVNRLSQYLVF